MTAPGFARVDVVRDGTRLPEGVDEHDRARRQRRAEAVDQDRPDLHVHARPERGPGLAALLLDGDQRRTGATVFKVYAGNGLPFNNNYAGLALGPDGTAYLATTGGMVALRDG